MPKNLLQQHFPMLQTREALQKKIRENPVLHKTFHTWKPSQQEEFLDFCTGEKGVKILYDCFFKEIFNPEYAPQRLNELLGLIMGQTVKILKVLPNDSTRIADEGSLLITDIVVELEDHSIANVEIQKIGYKFPGQRSACYSADLLLRQYKRIRGQRHEAVEAEHFCYRQIQNVYTIILFEHSTKAFHAYPEDYIHYFRQQSDTGLDINLLQEYYFIALDIFEENIHNKGIKTKLEAWLVFLTTEDPERILELIVAYPEFKTLYEEIYALCRNMEDVMGLFSEELLELDRNTVKYMIDEMQEEIDASKKQLEEKKQQLEGIHQQLEEKEQQLEGIHQQLEEKDLKLEKQEQQLQQQKAEQALYTMLGREGRTEELMQAVQDEAYRRELLREQTKEQR